MNKSIFARAWRSVLDTFREAAAWGRVVSRWSDSAALEKRMKEAEMTDEQRNGDAPMSIDERIVWAREMIACKEDEAKTSDSFALKLSLSSMRQHLAEIEAQVAERDARIRAEMAGKPTPLYDMLKAEGLNPPATVMLIGNRPMTDKERAYGLSLERELESLGPTRRRVIGRMRAAIHCLKDGQYIEGGIIDGLYEVGCEMADEIDALKAKAVEYAKDALLDNISDISETYWAASWQEGIVAEIKKAVTDPAADRRVWGGTQLSEAEVTVLRRLSEDAGGWPDDT